LVHACPHSLLQRRRLTIKHVAIELPPIVHDVLDDLMVQTLQTILRFLNVPNDLNDFNEIDERDVLNEIDQID